MGRRQPDLPARPAAALDRLRELLQEQEWVKGAVNYDEDLHFSTFYLRASCAAHTGRLYPGYTCLLALYEGFNEPGLVYSPELVRWFQEMEIPNLVTDTINPPQESLSGTSPAAWRSSSSSTRCSSQARFGTARLCGEASALSWLPRGRLRA